MFGLYTYSRIIWIWKNYPVGWWKIEQKILLSLNITGGFMQKNKLIIMLIGCLGMSFPISAQMLISSGGGFLENSSMSLDFTTGDVIVGDFSNSSMQILGGFIGVGSSVVVSNAPEIDLPKKFGLSQNYPNPFNPTTVINYDVPRSANIKLDVFNSIGVKVATLVSDSKPAGSYTIQFSANYLSSGMYFYRLTADGATISTKKMLLIK